MENFGTPNGHYLTPSGAQRAPQPFFAPDDYGSHGEDPMSSPPVYPTPPVRVIPATLMHGPYAAGYYTYVPGPEPQYTYHPAYNTTRGYNQHYPYPMQSNRASMYPPGPSGAAEYPPSNRGASFPANLSVEDRAHMAAVSAHMAAVSNPMPMHDNFEKDNSTRPKANNPDAFSRAPSGYRSVRDALAGASSGKHPLKQSSGTSKDTLGPCDPAMKRTSKASVSASKDTTAPKAETVYGRIPISNEYGYRVGPDVAKHKRTMGLNWEQRVAHSKAWAAAKKEHVLKNSRDKAPQAELSPPTARNNRKYAVSKPSSMPYLPPIDEDNEEGGPSLRKPTPSSTTMPDAVPMPARAAGLEPPAGTVTAGPSTDKTASDKTAKGQASLSDILDKVNKVMDKIECADSCGYNSSNNSTAGSTLGGGRSPTPEELSEQESPRGVSPLLIRLQDQFLEMLLGLSSLESAWIKGTPTQRAAMAASAREMMRIAADVRRGGGQKKNKDDDDGKGGGSKGKYAAPLAFPGQTKPFPQREL